MKKGFTLVEIMIVVAIIALLAAIAIPNLLRARVNANESTAQATLKTIATAAESFASANAGAYPSNMSAMLTANPAYLNENYTNGTRQGYNFTCTFTATSYVCNATPATINQTGTRSFAICTGAVMNTSAVGSATAPACP
ncbi:MAG: prepilin-type N-terminal cleavage/methylation domain-containing protein [Candidatus Omnitrophota bacterium]|jgi:prepilin-type N-terminal cleavage/methylation domain-containing protein|nr:MAG: prepilin-type N-terminal cleavage/methylation domain-containing protein [Candidatus Omnitrophota bacterium]